MCASLHVWHYPAPPETPPRQSCRARWRDSLASFLLFLCLLCVFVRGFLPRAAPCRLRRFPLKAGPTNASRASFRHSVGRIEERELALEKGRGGFIVPLRTPRPSVGRPRLLRFTVYRTRPKGVALLRERYNPPPVPQGSVLPRIKKCSTVCLVEHCAVHIGTRSSSRLKRLARHHSMC